MSGFELTDTKELGKVLDQLTPSLRKLIVKRGMRQAGARTRTLLRREAIRGKTGNLRKSIRTKNLKSGAVVVGLRDRFYYETLDLHSKRGAPLNPWFEAAMTRHAQGIGQLIVDKMKESLAFEAGRTYARSKAIRRRRW